MDVHLRKVFVHHKLIKRKHQRVDACSFQSSQRITFGLQPCHAPIRFRTSLLHPFFRSSVQVMISAVGKRQSHLAYPLLLIAPSAAIMSGVAISHRCKQAHCRPQSIVYIHMRLKSIQALGLMRALLPEKFYMAVPHIATHHPLGRKQEMPSEPIKQCPRKLLVNAQIVGSQSYHRIGMPVAEAQGTIEFCRCAGISQKIDMCMRPDIYKAHFSRQGIVRHVHHTYLPSFRLSVGHVHHTQLNACERVGYIVN